MDQRLASADRVWGSRFLGRAGRRRRRSGRPRLSERVAMEEMDPAGRGWTSSWQAATDRPFWEVRADGLVVPSSVLLVRFLLPRSRSGPSRTTLLLVATVSKKILLVAT
ncbi:hypothetical protein PVAP13_2NG504100 [Panicum virgatum]|uniref:Uncharacterized protein n=1 Tax=Panicum virgatum TaxID=38727 RepID=A0A8T0VRW1_PANVG|nr:hypothetical protein PVAP13_2NG504100 [Panicum virgatum]